MKQTLQALLRLAEVDNKIDLITKEQREIPSLVKEISTEIIALQQDTKDKEQRLQELQNNQKTINEFITEKTAWAVDREQRMNELKTNKEYQATLRETSNAKRDIKINSEALQALLPQLEEATKDYETAVQNNTPRLEDLKAQITEYKKRFDGVKDVVAAERKVREQFAKEVANQKILNHYENIHKRVSPVLAKAQDGVCCECGTRILPQVFNLLTMGETVQTCYGCKRILYVEESLQS